MLLVDFPSDILALICGELDAHSAVNCGRVCKVLHHIITTSLPVRYTVALAMRGMRAGKNESIDLGERLKKLERYETAWLNGRRKESFRVTLPEPMAFVNHSAGKFHVYHADGYLLTWDLATGQVHVVRLPSPLRGITLEEHYWQFTSPPDLHRVRTNVLLDAQNDTVMFVEVAFVGQARDPGRYQRITLRPFELSSGNTTGSISPNDSIVLVEKDFSYSDFSLRNEFLIMYLEQPRHAGMGIVVFNWVAQRKVLQVMEHVAFMTFLDDRRILSGFIRGADSYLRIYDLSSLDADGHARATHDFPLPLRPGFFVSSGSYIGRACGYPSTYSDAYEGAQYFSEDDWTMIYLCSNAQEGQSRWGGGASYRFELYVCTKELMRLTEDAPAAPGTVTIPWSTWGHAAATSLNSDTARFGKVAPDVVGSRMYSRIDRNGPLQIHDCHPARVRRVPSDRKYMIRRDAISDVAFLREDELQPGSPVVPRTLERVDYTFFMYGSDIMNTSYDVKLCGDVILVEESEASHPYGLKAIVAYSLA